MPGPLLLDSGLINQHHWNVFADGIHTVTLHTFEAASIRFQLYGRLAERANQDLQQFLTDSHMRVQFSSPAGDRHSYAAVFMSARARAITARYCRARSSLPSSRPSRVLLV